METYLVKIFSATTTDEVCKQLQSALDSLRARDYLAKLPDDYERISAESPDQVQDWFDDMKADKQTEEEGPLKEVYGLFDAARSRLRKLGFHRKPD
jgi:hypothetical protein